MANGSGGGGTAELENSMASIDMESSMASIPTAEACMAVGDELRRGGRAAADSTVSAQAIRIRKAQTIRIRELEFAVDDDDGSGICIHVRNTFTGDTFLRRLNAKEIGRDDFYDGHAPPALKTLHGFESLLCDGLKREAGQTGMPGGVSALVTQDGEGSDRGGSPRPCLL